MKRLMLILLLCLGAYCYSDDSPLVWVDGELIDITNLEEAEKPYIYQDPNDYWRCSKHGEIEIQDGDGFSIASYGGVRTILPEGTSYCTKCLWETAAIILNQHITGIKNTEG